MKIGIDVRKLRDYGIGTHIRNVVLPAARLASFHQFYLYCEARDCGKEDGNFLWVPETSSKYSMKEHFSLAGQARSHGIRLFHAPHYTLPLTLRCKSILTVHDLIHFLFTRHFPRWKVKAAEFVLRKALQKADLVLTVSETTRNDLLNYFAPPETKVEVLYNRISDEWFLPPPKIDLADLGIGRDFLLYVGNFKKHKGISVLLDAYQKLKDSPPLILVGTTANIDADLLGRIFQLRGVRLLGFAQTELLRKLYSQAMLFIFPSDYEGFGYPPVEAMACGAPVLSSDAPALKEILAEGAGYFQRGNPEELAFRLEELMNGKQMREQLALAGNLRAKKFATDESSRRLCQIYERFEQNA